ncbi:Fic family protein [Glycomyces tritici]|uniref:Fic family protein n=1 Tax=Glycomyces tritici TaxID=2665176 RepID=A0ABT7YNX0_9ACTN|nr:Fic/DOC family N-terminal domain-containing protein [Glycomyces tritici]MDN3240340.1 Fic family protein [Glycomyces tritici]
MELDVFSQSPTGHLTPIAGTDRRTGRPFRHMAYIPRPLDSAVNLQQATWQAVARANLALGRLDQASLQVPNPALLRRPTLRREAQSTSALEGTFAPLERVLSEVDEADETGPMGTALVEVLNYVYAAEHAFEQIEDGHAITVSLLEEAQRLLVLGTASERRDPGRLRTVQVAIANGDASIESARFIPMPPGIELRAAVQDLMDWVQDGTERDPVISAAMAHYQFETLHPFSDGNGRIGRMLIVLQLITDRALQQPLLSVSPWFEANRDEYLEGLYNVSAKGEWDQWIRFFSSGLEAAAEDTRFRVEDLLELQGAFLDQVQTQLPRSGLARDIAGSLIGYPCFTVPSLSKRLNKATPQGVANAVNQLVEIGLLEKLTGKYRHQYQASAVMEVLTRTGDWELRSGRR